MQSNGGGEVVRTGVDPAVVIAMVVGRGVDAIAVVGLAVDAGNAAVVGPAGASVTMSGQNDSIEEHFPSASSYVPPGHSHLSGIMTYSL